MYVCMYERICSTLRCFAEWRSCHTSSTVCFYIIHLGGLDVNHRCCNTHIHSQHVFRACSNSLFWTYPRVWSGLVSLAARLFVRQPAASEKESHRMICLPAC
jgi:hypothetical protein